MYVGRGKCIFQDKWSVILNRLETTGSNKWKYSYIENNIKVIQKIWLEWNSLIRFGCDFC